MTEPTKIKTDIIVVGAGIAGLWLHHRLNDAGYHSILVEKEGIGSGQTLSAQGIIHGGIKYTLGGILSGAASSIASMPKRWLDCLQGEGEINLSNTAINTDHQLMWSTQGLSSKLTAFFSSKAVSSKMTALEKKHYPELFQTEEFQGVLYALNEPVLDIPSLVKNLSRKWHHRMLRINSQYDIQASKTAITLNTDAIAIEASKVILASGEGNEDLLHRLNMTKPQMQRRPLQMLLAKGASLPPLFAHCIGSNTKPLITITSHKHSDGDTVWYIGGDIAEKGVGKQLNNLIEEARLTLKQLLPWIDTKGLTWATHSVNRAEPAQKNLLRPDEAFIDSKSNVYIVWPTKLALTPALGDTLLASVKKSKIIPNNNMTNEQSDARLATLIANDYYLPITPALWERVCYATD